MKEIIKEILKKFEEAEQLLAKLTPLQRDKLGDGEGFLKHHIKYGLQACDEILESGL